MYYNRAAESAKTLVFVAVLLQVIFFAIGVIIISIAIAAVIYSSAQAGVGLGTASIVGAVFGGIFLLGLLWIFLNYFLVYKPLQRGDLAGAETPALVLGILELIFGGIIPGILLIIAYTRIGNALVYQEAEKMKKEGPIQ